MNAALPTLTAETLASLRQQARTTGQTVMQRVQEQFGLDADATLHLLASHSHQPAFEMTALNALTVDFSQLDFNEAARRHCLVARDADAQLWLLLADPWDSASRAYAAHVLGVPFKTALAHPADLAALMARHEEGLHAMEGMGGGSTLAALDPDAETLSFASIAEDASPVVRLVRSTLYDALKAGASDIHLETDPRGLTVKYRIDGVLSHVAQVPGTETAEQAVSRIKVM
ncbi:MAG: type II/IV secretion system protein, partial [Thiobacillus sp.]|nr:type II/IV secretion system protein [Thiobacillus sp.]